MKALLRHEWHDAGAGEGEAPENMTRLLEKISVENEDNRKWLRAKGRTTSTRAGAESSTNAETPVPMDAEPEEDDGLDNMGLEMLRRKVTRLAGRGAFPKGVLSWNGEFGEEEERAMRRAGFLFEIYEVEYWWYLLSPSLPPSIPPSLSPCLSLPPLPPPQTLNPKP